MHVSYNAEIWCMHSKGAIVLGCIGQKKAYTAMIWVQEMCKYSEANLDVDSDLSLGMKRLGVTLISKKYSCHGLVLSGFP